MKILKFLTLGMGLLMCCTQLQAVELNIYGQGHLSVDNVDDGTDTSLHTASSSSRLGFNGKHEISNNLDVIFQFESGVDLTAQGVNDGNGGADSSGQIFTKGRPSFIGLQGDFGKILIGHMPFLDQWANDYNLFADQIGDLGNLWEASGLPGRSDNVIYYMTPDYSGFNVAATFVPDEGVDNSNQYVIKGNYSNNSLKLGLAFTCVGQGDASDDHTGYAMTVGYSFKDFTIGGGFQQEMDIGGISGEDRSSFSLAGSMKVGQNGKLKLQYAVSSSDNNQSDATQYAVGYDYSLAKNTVLYIAYANMDNELNTSFSVNGKGHGDKVVPLSGNDPAAFSVGIVYHFNHQLVSN